MKYTYQIRTGDFEYINGEIEGNAIDAVEAYELLKEAFNSQKSGPGLSAKEWNDWLDGYLQGKPGSVDEWAQMSPSQKECINEIKKAFKRIKAKSN